MTKQYIFIKVSNGVLKKVSYKDILFIESAADYCKIFTIDKNYLIHKTMHGLLAKLPTEMFFRCHNQFIVNVDKIESINGNIAYIGSNMILISKAGRSGLLQKINYIGTTTEDKEQQSSLRKTA